MRVLQVAWEYPPRIHGGLGRHVHGLAEALAAAGHDVHVVTTAHAGAPAASQVGGVVVHRAPAPAVEAPDWLVEVGRFNAAAAPLAAAVAARLPGGVDVVHTHDWMASWAALGVARAFDLPLVATIHATERARHQGWLPTPVSRYVHACEAEVVAAADALIACSAWSAAHVADVFDVDPADVAVVANAPGALDLAPVDRSAVAAARERHAPRGAPLAVFVGRVEYEKGVEVLAEAVRRVRRSGPPVRLVVAGDGTHRAALEALVVRLGLRRHVDLVGFVDHAGVRALLGAADVAVVPSLVEPFGIVALEAMAAGAPLVASAAGGLAEQVVDGVTGLLVPPGDPAALAAALRAVVRDPAAARSRAERARAAVAALPGWDEAARRTVEVYRRAVATHRPGARG